MSTETEKRDLQADGEVRSSDIDAVSLNCILLIFSATKFIY